MKIQSINQSINQDKFAEHHLQRGWRHLTTKLRKKN